MLKQCRCGVPGCEFDPGTGKGASARAWHPECQSEAGQKALTRRAYMQTYHAKRETIRALRTQLFEANARIRVLEDLCRKR